MNSVVDQITTKVSEAIQDQEDLFLVDVIAKGRGEKVIVLLDGDQGISIDKCAEVSRTLSRFLDEEVDLTSPMTLEVSSAGLDHPLKLNRQYRKNIGKSIRVLLNDQTEVTGQLLAVDEKKIEVKTVGTKKKPASEMEIEFQNINKTIVLVSFK